MSEDQFIYVHSSEQMNELQDTVAARLTIVLNVLIVFIGMVNLLPSNQRLLGNLHGEGYFTEFIAEVTFLQSGHQARARLYQG